MDSMIEIGGRPIGIRQPAYVIAEVGSNHNRDYDTAREMIDVAVEAGADAVKFQTYSGKRIYSTKAPKFEYLREFGDKPVLSCSRRSRCPGAGSPSLDVRASHPRAPSTMRRWRSWPRSACRWMKIASA